MNTAKLIKWITILGVFAMAARISMDTDTWWHLRAGQWIWEHKAVPRTDPFSYTRAGAPWEYPGWLVEVPLYGVYRLLGPGGLNLWTASMVALTFWLLWRTLTGGPFLRAMAIVLSASASGVYWAARPHLVTFVLTALFFWILEDHRWGRRDRLWWLPALMVVWANSHGGFAVGFILWGAYFFDVLLKSLIGRLKRSNVGTLERSNSTVVRLALLGVVLVLAVALNPSGPAMLLYPFKTVSIGALQEYIQEWQSPDFHSLSVQPFLWLLLLTLGAVGFSRRRMGLTDFLLVTGFAYLGFMAGRNIALFALVAPATLTRHADPLLAAWGRRLGIRSLDWSSTRQTRLIRMLNPALFGFLCLAVVAKAGLVFPAQANWEHFRGSLPVAAVEYLQQEHPPGRLFSSYNWGGYLVWALREYPVFIDGRTDLYNDELIDEWLQVVRGEAGWQAVLDRWEVNLILLEPSLPVVNELVGSGWTPLYADAISVIYSRSQ